MKKIILILMITLLGNSGFSISEKKHELIEQKNIFSNEKITITQEKDEEKESSNIGFVKETERKQDLLKKENPIPKTVNNNYFEKAIEVIKKLVEILYYCIFCIVAILTYKGARRTLFLPFDNEVFKFQIKEMEEVYRYSASPEKLYSGLKKNIYLNIIYVVNDYIEFNNWKETNLKFNKNDFLEDIKYSFIMKDDINTFIDNNNSKAKLNNWAEYKLEEFYISSTFQEEEKKLDKYINSPFLPKELLVELEKTLEKVEIINSLLREKISKISNDLPNKVKNTDDMKEKVFMLYNECVGIVVNNEELTESFEKILKIIRKNLNSDYNLKK